MRSKAILSFSHVFNRKNVGRLARTSLMLGAVGALLVGGHATAAAAGDPDVQTAADSGTTIAVTFFCAGPTAGDAGSFFRAGPTAGDQGSFFRAGPSASEQGSFFKAGPSASEQGSFFKAGPSAGDMGVFFRAGPVGTGQDVCRRL